MGLYRSPVVFLSIFCLMSMPGLAKPSTSAIRRLQTKVDFFLENIIDINHKLRGLREDINSLQQQNSTPSCDLNTCDVSLDSSSEPSNPVDSLIGEIEFKIKTVLKGFQAEKSVIRNLVKKHANNADIITRKVDNIQMELNDKYERQYHKTVSAVVNINETFHEHHIEMTEQLENTKAMITQVASDLQSHMKSELQVLKALVGRNDLSRHGTSMYKFHKEKLNWDKARQTCQEDNFHLAEINDRGEHEFVRKLSGNNIVWLGATDSKEEGVWRWYTSGLDINSSYWNKGEPNNDGVEDCLHNYDTAHPSFNDAKCSTAFGFVCELEL